MTDEELDAYNKESFWSKRQWGFIDPSLPYLFQNMQFSQAVKAAASRGLGPWEVAIVYTIEVDNA